MSLKVGDRVTVKIRDRSEYAFGAADSLDGAIGTVEGVSERSFNGESPYPSRAYLVHFNSPRAPWWRFQDPVVAFWFPPGDLANCGDSNATENPPPALTR